MPRRAWTGDKPNAANGLRGSVGGFVVADTEDITLLGGVLHDGLCIGLKGWVGSKLSYSQQG